MGMAGVGHRSWLDIDARLPSNHTGVVSVWRRIYCKRSCSVADVIVSLNRTLRMLKC